MKTGMLFSPVFVHPEPRRTRRQTASPTRLASRRLLQLSSSWPLESSKSHACNLFRFHTYGPPRKCGKQRTYRKPKSFRCNTYKKHRGEGLLWLTRNPRKDFYPEEHRDEGPASSTHPARCVCPVYPQPRRERPSGEKDPSLTLQPLNLPACKRPLIHSVHRDPAHQLGIKVRRFLRHHFARRRDFHHLLDVAGIQQERNLRAPAVHGVQRRARFPL